MKWGLGAEVRMTAKPPQKSHAVSKNGHKKGGSCITRLIWILQSSCPEKSQNLRNGNVENPLLQLWIQHPRWELIPKVEVTRRRCRLRPLSQWASQLMYSAEQLSQNWVTTGRAKSSFRTTWFASRPGCGGLHPAFSCLSWLRLRLQSSCQPSEEPLLKFAQLSRRCDDKR